MADSSAKIVFERMRHRKLIALSVILLCCTAVLWSQRRKKKDEAGFPIQTLELPKELPAAVSAESARLVFHVTPPSNKGLLSQQVRDGLKNLLKQVDGAKVVKLRAFVAGTGDLRRVPTIVGEVFTDKKLPLPALSVIQVGGLPLEGAQIVFESISAAKKAVNPNGVAFLTRLQPDAGVPDNVLSVTCYASTLDLPAAQKVKAAYPKAAVNVMQIVRAPLRAIFECEGAARLGKAPAAAVEIANGVVRVNAPRVVFSGSQMGFHAEDSDIRLAFQRQEKALAANGVRSSDVALAHFYPLTRGVADKVKAIQAEFFDKRRPPAFTSSLFEGLPSLDASFAMDVIAVSPATGQASPRP